MAKLLFKEGDFRILSDDIGSLESQEMMELVKTAGTTCYQSREDTKKTAPEFVDMFMKKGHLAMLDHTWFTVLVDCITEEARNRYMLELFLANSLFCISERSDESFIVSGNCRMFNEARFKDSHNPFIYFLVFYLRQHYPRLFLPLPRPVGDKKWERLKKSVELILNPELLTKEEVLVHRAVSVEFNNCSRGMTHETVRSRNGDQKTTAYAQESTRYVDYAKGDVDLDEFQMKFVLPFAHGLDVDQLIGFQVNGVVGAMSIRRFVNTVEAFYRALRKKGLKAQEARQFLPIGIKSQIVQTYNLNEWRHWFKIRTGKPAHPEIRFVAVKLLKELQSRIPDTFDDFVIMADGESAKYIGGDRLV